VKTVGPRQKTVSLQKAPETSKPRQGGETAQLSSDLLKVRGGQKGVSGQVARRGDDFEPQRAPRLKLILDPRKFLPGTGPVGGTEPRMQPMRGPGSSSRGGGDFVMLSKNDKSDFGGQKFPVNSIATLLRRLFPAKPPLGAATPQVGITSPGVALDSKWKPIKPGDGHSDNVYRGGGMRGSDSGSSTTVQGGISVWNGRPPHQVAHKPGKGNSDNTLL
jgi:hypothetical protein